MWFWLIVLAIIVTTGFVIRQNTGPRTWCLPHKMNHPKDFCENMVRGSNAKLEKELLHSPVKPSERELRYDVLMEWPQLEATPDSDYIQEKLDEAEDAELSKPCPKHGAPWNYYFAERLFGMRHINRFATLRKCVYGCSESKSTSGTWSYP